MVNYILYLKRHNRFEDNFAVVELDNKVFINIPKHAIPAEAKEGDLLVISINHDETNKRKEEVKRLMGELWKD